MAAEGRARDVIEALLAARTGTAPLARLPGLRSLEDGYRLQRRANAALAARFGPPVAWKIGGTSEAMRHYIGSPEPVFGAVFANTVHRSGARLERASFRRLGLESEIAVRLARDLPLREPPHGIADVLPAVGGLFAAIELVDDRYQDFTAVGAPTIVADNAFNAGLVLGRPTRDAGGRDLARLRVRTLVGGRIVAEAESSALMGHPLAALAWLADRAARLGWRLERGCIVSLGTITPVQWIDGPCRLRAEVEGIGAVEVRIV